MTYLSCCSFFKNILEEIANLYIEINITFSISTYVCIGGVSILNSQSKEWYKPSIWENIPLWLLKILNNTETS